mmetsp:Transcript_22056/g.48404  ORF Transcript_22056/g.48404 Transcript_22056/m.48404 type:complete len:201 (+) Transcript_22056:501-1103(+)
MGTSAVGGSAVCGGPAIDNRALATKPRSRQAHPSRVPPPPHMAAGQADIDREARSGDSAAQKERTRGAEMLTAVGAVGAVDNAVALTTRYQSSCCHTHTPLRTPTSVGGPPEGAMANGCRGARADSLVRCRRDIGATTSPSINAGSWLPSGGGILRSGGAAVTGSHGGQGWEAASQARTTTIRGVRSEVCPITPKAAQCS